MSNVKVSDLKVDEIVTLKVPSIAGWQTGGNTISGIVQNFTRQMIKGIEYRYIQFVTDKGLQGAYLQLTEEVTKQVMSAEELEMWKLRYKIRTLPRVVDVQGSDPEMFVTDKNGVVIPAFRFLPGKQGTYAQNAYWDGFQAEYNIEARSCLDQTVGLLGQGLGNLHLQATKYDKDAQISIKSVIDIPPHMLVNEDKKFVQFGCMPSKNVYGMKGIVSDGTDVPVRFAGGHIHLQLNATQKKRIEEYVKALDAILGVACVALFSTLDDPIRRKYYGLAGEYRTPSHGLEYRTLSNAWLCHPTATYIVFELARKVITLVDKDLFKHWEAHENDVISCINECNIPLAMSILSDNEMMFKDILMSFCYNMDTLTTAVYNLFMGGIETFIDKPEDVLGNWDLDGARRLGWTTYGRISNMKNQPNYKKLLDIKIK